MRGRQPSRARATVPRVARWPAHPISATRASPAVVVAASATSTVRISLVGGVSARGSTPAAKAASRQLCALP